MHVENVTDDAPATAYLTFTNLDLTEGRGSDRPCALHHHLGSALAFGKTAGVMGTHSGVTTTAVLGDLDGAIVTGRRVIGPYLDGLRQWKWGITPHQVAELSEEEKARLEQLQKQLGDITPQPVEPTARDEAGAIGVIWHRAPASIALTSVETEKIVGFIRVIVFSTGEELSDPEPRVAAIREANPDAPRMYVNVVDFGVPFRLKETDAVWSEPVSASELPPEERAALVDEYTALARKAGIL